LSGEEGAVVIKITAEMSLLGFDQVWVDEFGSAVGVIHGDLPGGRRHGRETKLDGRSLNRTFASTQVGRGEKYHRKD
jgi:hypothetical protein